MLQELQPRYAGDFIAKSYSSAASSPRRSPDWCWILRRYSITNWYYCSMSPGGR
ncbi:hypothetical protein KCP77_13570 [Salmonella enterica subsp. enterica]|nr:hypothetical protein KCP77_13570 [Salmonella enterica subsp. enterica]